MASHVNRNRSILTRGDPVYLACAVAGSPCSSWMKALATGLFRVERVRAAYAAAGTRYSAGI